MKVSSVLVVCVGNICRSPVGERALQRMLDAQGAQIKVSSAGVAAVVGSGADETANAIALAAGTELDGHVARQFTRAIGQAHDLILVMEPAHRRQIERVAPDLSGRVMLFDHWQGGKGIPDPYRRSDAFHQSVHEQILQAAESWVKKLAPGKNASASQPSENT